MSRPVRKAIIEIDPVALLESLSTGSMLTAGSTKTTRTVLNGVPENSKITSCWANESGWLCIQVEEGNNAKIVPYQDEVPLIRPKFVVEYTRPNDNPN